MDLENKEWKEFFIEDIFKIKSGKRLTKADMKDGKMPFIGATDSNNGITEFVSNKNSSLDKNVLGVNYNGSVVHNFYHPYQALFSDDVKRLSFKNTKGNRFLFLFVKTIILQQKSKYEYGYKFNGTRMKRQKILLPVNENGNPDYVFMENYMREKETELITKYQKYISSKIKHLEKELDKEVEWKEFFIEDIFEIHSTSSGIDKIKLTNLKGEIPYITRSDKTNGIDTFIGLQNNRYKKDQNNVITIGLDTQTVFYQKSEFYTGQNIQVLKFPEMNEHNAFFIIPLLKKQMEKFNWGGNGATLTRLRRTKILLPVNEKGNPDFEYMENYIKRIEQEKLMNYLKYKELNIS